MTNEELSQLRYLNREITLLKRKLFELEAAATGTTSRITGLPHVSKISDKTGIATEIADIRTEIEAKTAMSVVEYNRLTRFILGVDD